LANDKILVIEDNPMNMMLIKDLLRLGGWQVLEAMDAEDGIQLARKQLPALILMDIQLPGMDGLSATRIIKDDPQLKNIPVVALTSYAMQGDMDEAKQAGCVGYMTKPIDTRNFANVLAQYLTGNPI
jgi:CheY-like chemotaxis protein